MGRSGTSLFGLVGGLNYIHNVDELAMLWEDTASLGAINKHFMHLIFTIYKLPGLINKWKDKIKEWGLKQAMVHVYSQSIFHC